MNLIQVIQRAIDYIEVNILAELEHEDIARESFVSAFYLRRIFPVLCGTTLGEYIRNRRLSLSKDELMSSDSNILAIALKYGYNTPEGYTRAFYRFYGITPSAARSRKSKLDSYNRISVIFYYTLDMEKTVKWFTDILGWYAGIETRDENGVPVYGYALPFPGELVNMEIA